MPVKGERRPTQSLGLMSREAKYEDLVLGDRKAKFKDLGLIDGVDRRAK